MTPDPKRILIVNDDNDFTPYEPEAEDGEMEIEFASDELRQIAESVLPPGPEVSMALDLAKPLDHMAVASTSILCEEVARKFTPESFDRLLGAAFLIGIDNFDDIEDQFHGSTTAIAREFFAMNDEETREDRINAIRNFSSSAKSIFLAGMAADIEINTIALRENEMMITRKDFNELGDYIAQTSKKNGSAMDMDLLVRCINSYNELGSVAGHKSTLHLTTGGEARLDAPVKKSSPRAKPSGPKG